MATQGLVTVKTGEKVLMKVVAGCNGHHAERLGEILKKAWPVTAAQAYEHAVEAGFGGTNCLVVITGTEECYKGDNDLHFRYRLTFEKSKFNPRCHCGTYEYLDIVDV